MINKLPKHHILLSVENPLHEVSAKSVPKTEEAVKYLNENGEDAQVIHGNYGGKPEKSIMVSNPQNIKGIYELARGLGQESIFHSKDGKHQLVFLNGPQSGKVLNGEGTKFFTSKPKGDHSTILTDEGPVHFSHNLDPEETGKSEGLEKAATVPNLNARKVADDYAASKSIKLNHPNETAKVDPGFASKVASEYDKMPHNPNSPDVKASYDALINETMDQFHHIKNSGLKISPIKPGMPNPYNSSKDLHSDVTNNNHMWYYPTEQGFGSGNKNSDHPMLTPTKESQNGKPMLANDVFRIVHDYMGHIKDGTGFGPNGEETAYRSHAQMYSPLARKALASETRGQNSWVNFGPLGEQNRANPANTTYAEQKAGIMPEWTHGLPAAKSEMKRHLEDKGYFEDLQKTPVELPDMNTKVMTEPDQPTIRSKVTPLPNGLVYEQREPKRPDQGLKYHTLIDPKTNERLAFLETRHMANAPNSVMWGEVHPDHRGKGLGRQLYLATALHMKQLHSDDHMTPKAHKMWESFKDHPGMEVNLSPYTKNTKENFGQGSGRHSMIVSDPSKIDYGKMFHKVDLGKSEELDKGVKAFHGTTKVFDKFKLPPKNAPILNYGTGLYFATDPKEASTFAEYDPAEDRTAVPGAAPHVKAVDLDVKNPFDIHNVDHAEKIATLAGFPKSFEDMRAIDNDPANPIDYHDMLTDRETLGWNPETRRSDFWPNHKLIHPNSRFDIINKLIQKAGFDGIINKERGHVMVFNPKQVKSRVFGKSESKVDLESLAQELESPPETTLDIPEVEMIRNAMDGAE